MFIIVRKDERVLAQLTPGALLTWIDIDVSRCTDHRYAVQFETQGGADKCAGYNGAAVHSIGEWEDATARCREVSRSRVGRSEHRLSIPRDQPSRRATPAFAACACGSGPGAGVQPEKPQASGRGRDPSRRRRDPYVTRPAFRVIVNKFAT